MGLAMVSSSLSGLEPRPLLLVQRCRLGLQCQQADCVAAVTEVQEGDRQWESAGCVAMCQEEELVETLQVPGSLPDHFEV